MVVYNNGDQKHGIELTPGPLYEAKSLHLLSSHVLVQLEEWIRFIS